MAYVQSPLPKEEQNTQAPSGTTTPNPLSQLPAQTGGSVGQGGSAGATKAAGVGSPTQFGSNASKLSDYLSANTDQVQQMGQNIAGTLNQNFSQIQGDVNQAGKDFANTVQNSYTAPNQELVGRAASNPTDFVKNPNDVSAFQSQLNDSYTGPTAFESTAPYANVQGKVNQAVQGSGLLNTHAGLSSYLQNNVEKNPTQGQNTLDTVLLESQPEAIKSVQDAAKQFSGLGDYLGQTTKDSNALIPQAQQAASGAKAGAQTALTNQEQGLLTQINNKLGPAQTQYTNQNALALGIQQAINNNGTLTPEQAQAIGLDPSAYSALIGIMGTYSGLYGSQPANLGNFYTPNSTVPLPPSVETVSSPDDYAMSQALDQLSGGWDQNPLKGGDISKAGTWTPVKSGNLDLPKAQQAVHDQFVSADQGKWHSFWNGSPRFGDPNAITPADVKAAGMRLQAAGILNTDWLPVGYGSNKQVYG